MFSRPVGGACLLCPIDGENGESLARGMVVPSATTMQPAARISTILIVIVVALLSRLLTPQPNLPEPVADEELGLVRRVVDGDTLLLEDGRRIRLIGVDTPESVKPDFPAEPFGPEAAEFTGKLLTGRQVRLVYDRERFDQYGRTLAFVYLDDLLVNEELIRQGLSPAQLQYPYRSDMKTRFKAAEKSARERRIGIWSLSKSGD